MQKHDKGCATQRSTHSIELPGKNADQFATGPLQALKISQMIFDATLHDR